MEMKKIIFILFHTLIFNYQHEHSISMFGLPMAIVNIDKKDTVINNINCTKIVFKTKTNRITSRFFRVDNVYETIINKNTQSIVSFKKSTYQPNVINKLETELINGKIKYKNSDKIIHKNYLNIFSLLHYLETTPYEKIESSKLIDREGLLYNCNIYKNITGDLIEFKLDFNLLNNLNDAIIEHTDLFTWALFKKDAINKIIVKNSRIESCNFKSGLANLKSNVK